MKKIFSVAFLTICAGIFCGKAQDTITVNFAYTGAVQNWTVPCGVKQVKINAVGAAGGYLKDPIHGTYYYIEGKGASITGLCNVIAGDNLSIVVGGNGVLGLSSSGNARGAGGGGGSFVYDSTTLNLIAVGAGGGGASLLSKAGGPGGLDIITDSATKGQGADTTGGIGGNGGSGGSQLYGGSGGAGWYSNGGNGQTSPDSSFGGKDRMNLFAGGVGYKSGNGGYGGGGGGGEDGGGGGGGYNGGGGGFPQAPGGGGGGGSYLNGTLVGTPIANNTGAGHVSVTYIVNPLKVNDINVNQNVSCNGGNNGSASIVISGGNSPYSYSWSDAKLQTTASATGLSAGSYTVNVSDSCGTFITDSIKITQPDALKASASVSANVKCNGENGGIGSVIVTGGSSPYTYSWSDVKSQTTASATGLIAGSYTVTVSDSCGAFITDSIKITQPASIMLTADSTNVATGCDGSAWVIASGGRSPYNYLWNTAATTDTITNQCGGSYCCLVTDSLGCRDSICTTINITTQIENINAGKAQFTFFPALGNGKCSFITNCPANVDVYNMLGQKILSAKTKAGQTNIDLSNNSAGIYFYRVFATSGEFISEGKFIIQK